MDSIKQKVSFEVKANVLEEYSSGQLAIVEVYVCHDGNNHHNMPIPLKAIKKASKTLQNKFLVAGYDGTDFEGHEPDEQIVGFFPENSKMSFRKKDGKTFLVAQAVMSKVYAPWAYDILVNDDNHKDVSMEISVFETEVNDDDGLEHITEFIFNGVTLLGEAHSPACEGADASIIRFTKENALQFYDEHFGKNSDSIKRDFIKNMSLTDSGKEESENMEENLDKNEVIEEVVATEEVEVATEEITETQPESFEEKPKEKVEEEEMEKESDDEVYMEEDDKDSKKDSEEEDEDDDEDEDSDKDFEEKEFASLTVEQKYEVFRAAVQDIKCYGYLESYDDEYVYVFDWSEMYTYRYSYSLEGTTCSIDEESKARVMRAGYVEFTEEGVPVESEEVEALRTENCELKTKVAVYEQAEKEKEIEAILSNVVDSLSSERIAELREQAGELEFEALTQFENEVKAEAFEAVKDEVGTSKYSFTRMSISQEQKTTSKYGW